MTSTTPLLDTIRGVISLPRTQRGRTGTLIVGAGVAAFSLTVILAVVPPPPPSAAAELKAYVASHAQTVNIVKPATGGVSLVRDGYSASPGVQSLIAGGTNYDWAKLVMLYGGWRMSDANVTVFTRWMRQENGADDWWNRNNPLNNGYGSGGGGGTGSFANLDISAQMAAAMLHHNPGMAGIVAGFAAGNSTTATEQAIWASPWASSHYGNGSRWHYTPVDVVTAPASAW
jgi:hypothetical protein